MKKNKATTCDAGRTSTGKCVTCGRKWCKCGPPAAKPEPLPAGTHDGLRLGLRFLWNRRGDDGLTILSMTSGVSLAKIKRFIDGDDSAINRVERAALEVLQ